MLEVWDLKNYPPNMEFHNGVKTMEFPFRQEAKLKDYTPTSQNGLSPKKMPILKESNLSNPFLGRAVAIGFCGDNLWCGWV